MLLNYILLIIIIIYLLFRFYLYKKFGFWIYQPVYHFHNIYYWFHSGVINNDLPKINKFCNFYNVKTENFNNIDDCILDQIINLIHKNYYSSNNSIYLPSKESFISHLEGNNSQSFVSIYTKKTSIDISLNDLSFNLEKIVNIPNTIIGSMISKPLNISFINEKFKTKIYYVDYLCIDKNYRKSGIASEIIQTHEYIQAHKNNKYQISLFKREGNLTGIVELSKFNSYLYYINNIKERNFPYGNVNLIEINKQNIQLLIEFLEEEKNKFEIFIVPDLTNLLNLIIHKTYYIYGLLVNHKLKSIYFFKDSFMFYKENKEYKEKNNKCIEFFASINGVNNIKDVNDELFINGFISSLSKISKKEFQYIYIESISHNYLILNEMLKQVESIYINPVAYFFYNYAKNPIKSNKLFILC